jgi:PKD repeat protein
VLYFYYNGVKVPEANVAVISENFADKRYRLSIVNPQDMAALEIQDEFGCGVAVNTDLLDISVNDPSFTYTSPEYERYGTISERTSVSFVLSGTNSYDSIVWDFGDASAVKTGVQVSHIYQEEGTYNVTMTVFNTSGCFKSTAQQIVVGKGYSLVMPNIFTPNNDNINDRIGPSFTGLKDVSFYVYNKSGVLIYEESVKENNTTTIPGIEIVGWDGSNPDPNSNYYVYKIIAIRLNDEVVTKTGTIFLLK